jgi:N-acetylglucosaminyldiphosphoundecaprenol N-acetyl-beta-D-mannosaminyltransferase
MEAIMSVRPTMMLPLITFLNTPMHSADMVSTVEAIFQRIEQKLFTQHVVINVAKLVNVSKDQSLRESVSSCDIINIDGMGVVWGARLLGYKVPERVTGIDLFLALNNEAAKRKLPVFFLGARQDVVAETARRMQARYPGLIIAGYHHGYFWDYETQLVETIKESGASLLFVAISTPMKENFIHKWRNQLGVQFVMGVGGTFDVITGKVKRAPLFMQKTGMEWLYRLYQEPERMWKRYFMTNTEYLIMLFKEILAILHRGRHVGNHPNSKNLPE